MAIQNMRLEQKSDDSLINFVNCVRELSRL